MLLLLRQAQRDSVDIAASVFDIDVKPGAWIGHASDGRDLSSLLDSIPYRALHEIGKGSTPKEAMKSGAGMATMITKTQLADTSRSATQVGIAADTSLIGWVRVVHLPACARCIILADRLYKYSDGFLRHPGCDCSMRGVTEDEYAAMEPQDPEALIDQMRRDHPERLRKSLSESDLSALDHGADLNQIVNAHRSMYRASAYGRNYSATHEGTTRRGYAGMRLNSARTPRLTPDEILQMVKRNGGGRSEVIRQLKRFGYI